MKKISQLILVSLFLIFICSISLFLLFSDSKDMSETEYRSLAQAPEWSFEAIKSGTYTDDVDAYVTDQFPVRDLWIKSYLNWQIFSQQTFIHDFYLADDWVYPRPFTEINYEAIDFATKQMEELARFTAEEDVELFFFSLPDRRYMIDMDFPRRVENNLHEKDKETLLSRLQEKNIPTIDIGQVWKEKYDTDNFRPYYFRTDHHWNIEGAFLAYEEIHESLRQVSNHFHSDAFDESAFEKHCVEGKEFRGSYNRQLFQYIDAKDEPLCYYLPKNEDIDDLKIYKHAKEDENIVHFSDVFATAKNSDSDLVTYGQLYADDYDELHIINEKKKGKVLILKDSYSSPLIPLLANNYEQTTIYDVRHNEGRDLQAFIKQHDFDTVLFLYSNGRTLEPLYNWS